MYAEVSAPIHRRGRTTWSGRLGGKGTTTGGTFDFVVVQYGTIDIVLLLTLLYFLIFGLNSQSTAQCYQQAIHQCGDMGNVKVVNVTRGITGVFLEH